MTIINKIMQRISRKTIYFSIAGLLGALSGSIVGEIPFLITKTAGIDLSKNILEIKNRVRNAGGKTGDIQISLAWNNHHDLDLHVVDPDGEEIYFSHKKSISNGELDVDRNISGETDTPVENIVWTNNAPDGLYKVYVKFYGHHKDDLNTDFTVVVNSLMQGYPKEFNGSINTVGDMKFIHEFNFISNTPARIESKLFVGLWGGSVGLGVAFLLALSQRRYLKQHLLLRKESIIVSIGGVIAGVISSLISNYLYILSIPLFFAWSAMGALLGLFLIKSVPNLPLKSGVAGGAIGGLIGGLLFMLFSNTIGEGIGRILGAMAIGFFVGLMIALSEDFFKEAWLEIEWQKNEKSTVSLGKRPIIIGSSPEADIYLPATNGFSSVVGEISFKDKVITYTDYMNKKNTLLKNGSKITLGRIIITVNAIK